MEKLIEIIKQDNRYSDFIFLSKEVLFKDLFKNQNIDTVQIHDTTVFEHDNKQYIVGFAGVFSWKDNTIHSSDGDTYTENTRIIGYDWFKTDTEECLDILATYW